MTDKLLIEALEETRDTLAKVLIKIRRDAPDLSGKLLGHADQVIARVDALLDAQAHRSQARRDLIERLKSQATAHRYMAETESADLIDEAVIALAAHRSQQEVAQEPRLCGFCGKSQHQVKKLLATPCAAICDECNQTAGRVLGTSTAPSESEARVQAALRRLLRSAPTDGDMVEAGWERCEIEEACAAIEEAHAALSASGQKGEPT